MSEIFDKLISVVEGIVNYTDNVNTKLNTALGLATARYTPSTEPIVTLPIEKEFERLTGVIDCDIEKSYVLLRGTLMTNYTLRYDNTKYAEMYVNGVARTADYTFSGDTADAREYITVLLKQTDLNVLNADFADFPLENLEVFVHIGTTSRYQPNITSLLESDDCLSLYVDGDFQWMTANYCPIVKLTVMGTLSMRQTYYCPSLRNLIVPNTTNLYKNGAGASAIRHIDISNMSGNIADNTFEASKLHGEITIDTNGIIGSSAFINCNRLTKITIGDKVTAINSFAFKNCKGLTEIKIGNSVKTFGSDAISYCENLNKVHIGNAVTAFNSNVFTQTLNITELSVENGYHCANTQIPNLRVLNWKCFASILTNCADINTFGRTATTMYFKVSSEVRTALTNAYNSGDETAIEIYRLMNTKSISINT